MRTGPRSEATTRPPSRSASTTRSTTGSRRTGNRSGSPALSPLHGSRPHLCAYGPHRLQLAVRAVPHDRRDRAPCRPRRHNPRDARRFARNLSCPARVDRRLDSLSRPQVVPSRWTRVDPFRTAAGQRHVDRCRHLVQRHPRRHAGRQGLRGLRRTPQPRPGQPAVLDSPASGSRGAAFPAPQLSANCHPQEERIMRPHLVSLDYPGLHLLEVGNPDQDLETAPSHHPATAGRTGEHLLPGAELPGERQACRQPADLHGHRPGGGRRRVGDLVTERRS